MEFKGPQKEAIIERNKNLLVSASAGTGKTTVMIERVAGFIKSGEASLNDMLIITFTKAASRDMKAKLLKKLIENEENKYCQDAIGMLSTCDISTLDAFCQKILKTYFFILGIDPSFKILDETEEKLIKGKVFKNILTKLYLENKSNENLIKLISFYYKSRNEASLADIIFKIVRNIEVRPNKDEFKREDAFKGYNLNVIDNSAFKFLCKNAREGLEKIRNITLEVVNYVDEKLAKKLNGELEVYNQALMLSDDIEFFNSLMLIKKPGETENAEDDIKLLLKKRAKIYKNIKDGFGAETTESIIEDLRTNKEAVKLLLRITEEFEKEYNAYKEKYSVLDFSQVEDLAYKILENEDVRNELLKKYKYVFVDEYQDINELQNKIIARISSGNTFEVGDVKQSIYGFRLTSPKIFSEKFEEYKNDKTNKNKLVKLNRNFRNINNGVNKFVDNLFSVIMTPKTANINYEEDGRFLDNTDKWEKSVTTIILEEEKTATEVKTIDSEKPYSVLEGELDTETTKAKREGIVLAEKIKEDIRNGYSPSDISVISRTKGVQLKQIVGVLNYEGIQTENNYGVDLLTLPEVLVLHNYLLVISNFKQDIPLTSVLLSPIYALSLNDLAVIKAKYKETKFFYDAILSYANSEADELSIKLNKVLTDISALYFKSQNLTISNLAREIIKDFDYLNKFKVIKNGRIENIYSYLAILDSFSDKTLIDYIIQTGDGSLETKGIEAGINAVKINTIHSSKGLDYKVVYLVLAGKDFNDKDTKESLMVTDDFGIAISNYSEDDEEPEEKKNIVLSSSKIKSRKNLIQEEIRLLYVALTRAKEKLTVIGTKNEDEKFEIKTEDDVMDAVNYLQWIIGVKNEACLAINIKAKNISQSTKESKEGVRLLNVKTDSIKTNELRKIIEKPVKKTDIKQKMSVSQILDLDKYFREKEEAFDSVKTTSKDEGILYHKFLEKFDINAKNYSIEKERVLTRYFSIDDRNAIKGAVLDNILKSGLIDILKSGELRREQKFIFKDDFEGLKVLVIGMIDALIIKQGEFIIIDYKASNKPIGVLKKIYLKQLEIYSKAVSKILNISKFSAYLFNINTCELLEVLHK